MENKISRKQAESGNMLFLILIAVALFAALSYVVTYTTRSGSGDASSEKTKLIASEIFNHAISVQSAITRIYLGGCSLETLNFKSVVDGTLHENPDAPVNGHCDVFSNTGGGAVANEPDKNWTNQATYYYAGSAALTNVGTTCTEASCADLVMILRGITPELCTELNKRNGILTPIASLPTDTQEGCPYKGTFDCNGNNNVEVIFADPELRGHSSICYNDTVHGYTYTHALLER
ncbi:MAG: hypothetical protein DI551_02220 [Micavibrio aeruginosavorus]|uniref:Uncharacterized protein n=1 Tax=Micavibrio aeruginosavorus TaxID=349221 RepID=A0A2W5N3I4_9BACT|nr:MAG: hypothetical protein DI551_02220 [Micavibrio aeruginosavorus]